MAKPFLIWAPEADTNTEFQKNFENSDKKILRIVKTLAEFEGLLNASDKALAKEEWSLLCYGDVNESVVSQVKRHPDHHLTPVFGMKKDVRPEESEAAQKKGVNAIVELDDFAALTRSIEKVDANALPRESLRELDESFVAELGDQTADGRKLSEGLNAERVNELYRLFHTIKGTAKSLQFPHLGNFMHEAEEFLSVVKSELIFQHPFVTEILEGTFAYLEDQAEQLRAGRLLELPPVALVRKLSTFLGLAKCGWVTELNRSVSVTPAGAGSAVEDPAAIESAQLAEKGLVSRTSSSTRVSNEKLDELQNNFKKIVQLRTKLSTFTNNLKSEFADESFPNDLVRIVDGMTAASSSIMDFFISLRVVPPTRLKTFTASLVAQTSAELSKEVDFEFKAEPGIEVDGSVLDVLEGCLAHLIKNCIDHGIGKSGKVRLEISKTSAEQIRVFLGDDGKGIDHGKLKALVTSKGLMSEEAVNRLSMDSLNDLIFLDGLSTKTEVSDLSGRGVGMSAVKEEITKLGGQMKVESEPNAGTRFIISLPRIFKL